jgi:hypothetical protein
MKPTYLRISHKSLVRTFIFEDKFRYSYLCHCTCKSKLFLKTLSFHVPNRNVYILLSLISYCYAFQYIPSLNIWVPSIFSSRSSRYSLYFNFVSSYIILDCATTRELVSSLKTLHGTRMKLLLRATKCPYWAKHVTNAVKVIELMTQNSTNTCLLELQNDSIYSVSCFLNLVWGTREINLGRNWSQNTHTVH